MKNIHIKDNGRTLIYQPLPKPTKSGVVATLIGYRKNGITRFYALLALIFSIGLFITACQNGGGGSPQGQIGVNSGPNGENPTVNGGIGWDATTNIHLAATGTVDQTGNWNAGFTVTFKDAVPPDVARALKAAGGIESRGVAGGIWTFPNVKSPNDPALMKAVTAAAGSGSSFTITPLATDH